MKLKESSRTLLRVVMTASRAGIAAGFLTAQTSALAQTCADSWSPVGNGVTGEIRALLPTLDQLGRVLLVGGNLMTAGSIAVPSLARWDGEIWSAFDPQPPAAVDVMTILDLGSGPSLYAVVSTGSSLGRPSQVVHWEGGQWVPVGTPISQGPIVQLVALNLAGVRTLIAAGNFTYPLRWDGNSWVPVSPNYSSVGRVTAMAVYDSGTGESLYIGGGDREFCAASYYNVTLKRFDGSSWLLVGGGVGCWAGSIKPSPYQGVINVLFPQTRAPFAGMWVGGHFSQYFVNTNMSGQFSPDVARWSGSFSAAGGVGAGGCCYSGDAVNAFCTGDLGHGARLFAGGSFISPGNNVAGWNGQFWEALGAGVNGPVRATAVFDDGRRGPRLYVAGTFTSAGGSAAMNIASWGGQSCYANCDGSLAGSCPALEANDFQCFLNRFTAGDPWANCDGSLVEPVLNINDFICFMNRFAAGCS